MKASTDNTKKVVTQTLIIIQGIITAIIAIVVIFGLFADKF